MADPEHFDALVIGSGQGGNPLAKALAKAGKRTAVIEREHIGGTCVNEGLYSDQDDGRQRDGWRILPGAVATLAWIAGRSRLIWSRFANGSAPL